MLPWTKGGANPEGRETEAKRKREAYPPSRSLPPVRKDKGECAGTRGRKGEGHAIDGSRSHARERALSSSRGRSGRIRSVGKERLAFARRGFFFLIFADRSEALGRGGSCEGPRIRGSLEGAAGRDGFDARTFRTVRLRSIPSFARKTGTIETCSDLSPLHCLVLRRELRTSALRILRGWSVRARVGTRSIPTVLVSERRASARTASRTHAFVHLDRCVSQELRFLLDRMPSYTRSEIQSLRILPRSIQRDSFDVDGGGIAMLPCLRMERVHERRKRIRRGHHSMARKRSSGFHRRYHPPKIM